MLRKQIMVRGKFGGLSYQIMVLENKDGCVIRLWHGKISFATLSDYGMGK